ncbi:hypothetical protein [Paenibacillus sp. Soil750]|uniref:hypothetical protein n=1 Tax=Paenibacillus sp. Soil750 TaxID=1736398 RepID=UPI0006F30EAF|nr:hypothetical protein [Paenibacillus sp. Soil750]KRE70878.1 hypothetical protein ASL11_11330 [Paenibacillus sp. Soil750]
MDYPPDYTKFYVLRDTPATRPFRGDFVNQDDWFSILRGEQMPKEMVVVKHTEGTRIPSQIIYTSPASPLLFHEKLIDKFVKEGISGWELFEVDVLGKSDEIYNGYFGLSIKGRCSSIDYASSLIVYREFPGGSFPYFQGRYFKDNYWDGSDFFMENADEFGATGFQYCSERVKRILDELKVKSIKLEKLTEFEIDVNTVKIGSPGRLPKGITFTQK